jgi:hypothetical protein
MRWRRSVVLFLGCIVGLLTYLAGRVCKGGLTASLLCAGVIAFRLGSGEATFVLNGEDSPMPRSLRELVSSHLYPLVIRCTSEAGRSMS